MAMGFSQGLTGWLDTDPLKDYFVFWDEIGMVELKVFSEKLQTAKKESDFQHFFEAYPIFLIQFLGGGQGRWVIPQKALRAEYVTDFLIADKDSLGFHWKVIELKHPSKKAYKNNGNPTSEMTDALEKIRNWRSWLEDNLNYAQRKKESNGLGLTEITPDLPGLIIIGRRNEESEKHRIKRRNLGKESNIEIHTYDWLFDRAEERVEALNKLGDGSLEAYDKAGFFEYTNKNTEFSDTRHQGHTIEREYRMSSDAVVEDIKKEQETNSKLPPVNIGLAGPSIDVVAWGKYIMSKVRKFRK
jgi:hypothetical protein